jgi:hypothetical protein
MDETVPTDPQTGQFFNFAFDMGNSGRADKRRRP